MRTTVHFPAVALSFLTMIVGAKGFCPLPLMTTSFGYGTLMKKSVDPCSFFSNGSHYLYHQKDQRKAKIMILLMNSGGADDDSSDEAGADLAADFFKNLKGRGIDGYEGNDNDEEDDEDESDQDISISAINAFRGVDKGKVGKLAGNVTFTNKELYSSLKERVLESPSAFSNLVGAGNEEEDDQVDEDDASIGLGYYPPSQIADSGLVAGEVVTTVLSALTHNDIPTPNYGVQILFAYSSRASVLKSEKAPTVEEYADFLRSSEYSILLNHAQVIVDKADYSFDRKKSYFTVRLRKEQTGRDFTTVNFILSTTGSNEDDCWLIDSILIRPDGIRRKGRR